jgi:O-antigen ligase
LIYACFYAAQNVEFINVAIGDRFEGIYAILLGQESTVSGDDVRLKMIDAGLSGWVNSPLIGHGVDSFKYLNQNITGHFYYSHNNFVEVLYNFGILGFILYYGFIARLMYRIIKIPKCNKLITSFRSLAIGLIIVFLIRDIGGISYYSTLPQFLICISFVIYLLLKKYQNENIITRSHNG